MIDIYIMQKNFDTWNTNKKRIHSKTTRIYDRPQTAYQRVLVFPDIPEEIKEKLREKYAKLNPKILKQKCDQMLRKLSKPNRRLR